MKIKLGDKTFEQLKFKGRIVRNLLEIEEQLEAKNGRFDKNDLDVICEFLANTFDGSFSSDDLLDELEFPEIIGYFRQVQQEVAKKTNKKMSELAKK